MRETKRGNKRREEILDYMNRAWRSSGLFPTIREVAIAVYGSAASYTSAQHHMNRLLRQGKLVSVRGARGIELPGVIDEASRDLEDISVDGISRQEAKVLEYVMSRHPRSCSYREIGDYCGMSVGTVYKHVGKLQGVGLLEKSGRRTRSIRLKIDRNVGE